MNGEVVSETGSGLAARLAVACTWCSKSIGHRSGGHKSPIPKSPLSSSSSSPSPPPADGKKGKEDSKCSCRKPRARCALCLSRLNTSSSLALFAQRRRPDSALPKFPFDSFTVFCATCRHSGHAVHYLEWFTSHKNCPVAGCTCTCSSLDPVLRLDHHSHHSG